MEAKVAANEADITNLKDRVNRFQKSCSGHRKELKDMIEKVLENELHEVKERLDTLQDQLTANGIPVKKRGILTRLKSVDTIINAVIAGLVAIVVALISRGWRA